jgi:hypothetical protein
MAFGNQFKKWIEGGHGVESTIADVEWMACCEWVMLYLLHHTWVEMGHWSLSLFPQPLDAWKPVGF